MLQCGVSSFAGSDALLTGSAGRRKYSESPTTSPTGGEGGHVDEQFLLR